MKTSLLNIVKLLVALWLLNFVSSRYYYRFDMTEDKRYTLSDETVKVIESINDLITINVYLKGSFPAEFKRLQIETNLFLEEFRRINRKIQFKFIDPQGAEQELIDAGLTPSRLYIQEEEKASELIIFPWAVVSSNKKTERISLLKDIYSNSQEEQLESSIQQLEYAITDAIYKVTSRRKQRIAILKGNKELADANLVSLLSSLKPYYHIAPFTLDSVATIPKKTLRSLQEFDVAIIAKPKEVFSETEKYVLDQYLLNGGKTIWAVDHVNAELDSIMDTGNLLAYATDLNLDDFFFKYGARINYDLIQDLNASEIPVVTGNVGNQPQVSSFLWPYHPLSVPNENHPITTNIERVQVKFPNSIDLLKNKDIAKTILLTSSTLSKKQGVPSLVSLDAIQKTQTETATFNQGIIPIAVLLEGEFKSVYSNRVKPLKLENHRDQGVNSQMIIISDGDVLANEFHKGSPVELGVNKWNNRRYGNKDFILNAIHYLLDDKGLLKIRSKKVKVAFLNKERAYKEVTKWQFITLFIPITLIIICGVLFNYLRKRRYGRN